MMFDKYVYIYTHTCNEMITTIKLINISTSSHGYRFLLVVRAPEIYSLQISSIQSRIINHSHNDVHQISTTYLSCATGALYPVNYGFPAY